MLLSFGIMLVCFLGTSIVFNISTLLVALKKPSSFVSVCFVNGRFELQGVGCHSKGGVSSVEILQIS